MYQISIISAETATVFEFRSVADLRFVVTIFFHDFGFFFITATHKRCFCVTDFGHEQIVNKNVHQKRLLNKVSHMTLKLKGSLHFLTLFPMP
jgi:hypothetical protein